MNFYKKYILSYGLNLRMSSSDFEKLRPGVISLAKGVVLEVGAGSGLNLPYYKNIEKLIFLEPLEKSIELAKQKQVSFPVHFVQGDAEQVPLEDNSVDTVVSTWTLCSIGDVEKAMLEIKRVLKPGGQFVFIDHGKSNNNSVAILQNIANPFSRLYSGNCHLNRNIEKIIQDAGFCIEKLEKFREKGTLLIYNYKGIATNK